MTSFCLALAALALSSAPLTVSAQDQAAVVEAVITHLQTDYVDADIGARAGRTLERHLQAGRWSERADAAQFADALSTQLQDITGDGHLNVEFTTEPVEIDGDADDAFDAAQMERWYGAHINFGVQSVGRTADNVGILDLRVFAPLDMGGETLSAALNVIAHTDALIIDLRRNGGGIGDAANLVASYLVGPERQPLTGIYDRPSDTLTQAFTAPFVPGDRFGPDKPVYVLISSRTFSAAEALAYDLQALGRATIVGETSGGGAHPFHYLPIHPHFVLWSVTAKSVNPITGGNWQGAGVAPDIVAPAEDALDAALAHLAQAGP